MHSSNNRGPKYITQTLRDWKGEIYSKSIIVGEFNVPFSTMDRWSTHKINKKTLDLNYSLYQINLPDINRIFHTRAVNILSSHLHICGTLSQLDHMLSHKTSL